MSQATTLSPAVSAFALPRQLWLTLLAASCGFVVVLLDVTIVNVALPHISAGLRAGVNGQQWVVDAYTLALASLTLSGGSLGDRYGSKRIFGLGLQLFALASLACGVAPSLSVLIAARAIQGMAAALILPTSLALISHACSGQQGQRVRAIGLWSSVGGLVSAAGPAIGGGIIMLWGWPSIFLINIPVCILGLWLSHQHVRESPRQQGLPFDWFGQLSSMLLFASFTATVLEAGGRGWGDNWVLAGILVASVAGLAFVRSQQRAAAPVLPLGLLRQPVFSSTLLLGALSNLAFYGLIFVLSNYFQRLRGFSALEAGLALLPFVVVMLGNMASGPLSARWGARLPILLGLSLTALGYALLYCQLQLSQAPSYWALLPGLMLMPFGGGLTVPALTAHLLGHAEAGSYATVSAAFSAARQLGAALGVALLGGMVAGAQIGQGTTQAFGIATLTLLVCVLLAAWRL
jgi:DHA2 family methylenomycin A resistance protein-like MFS transporter